MVVQAAQHHLQNGPGVQTKKGYELHHGKSVTGFLPGRLGITFLIFFGVSQLRSGAVDDLDGPAPQSCALGGSPSGCLRDGTQGRLHLLFWQTLACLNVSRVVLVDRSLSLEAQQALNLTHHFPAGRARFKHLPDEALESKAQVETAVAAVGALLLLREQMSGNEVADLFLELNQSSLAQGLEASAPQSG